MSITVPDRSDDRHEQASGGGVPLIPAQAAPPDDVRPPSAVRLGKVDLRTAAAYLLAWTAVLFAVEVLVLWTSHAALARFGVLESVSRATATVLGEPEPASGVLPALEWSALLPWVLVVAGALAVLWWLASLALVLAHNGICALTGGPRVHVR